MKQITSIFFILLMVGSDSSADESDRNAATNCGISKFSPEAQASDTSFTCGNKAEFFFGTENNNAVIRLSPFGKKTPLTLSLSAPFDSAAGASTLLDFDGLAGATSIKLNYEFTFMRDWSSVPITEIVETCDDYVKFLQKKGKKEDTEIDCNKDADDLIDKLVNMMLSGELSESEKFKNFSELVKRPFYTFGTSAQYGHQSFDYLKAGSLESVSSSEEPWSVGVNLNYIKPGDYVIGVEYQYQKTYIPQNDITRCPTDKDIVDCISGADGAPLEQTNRILKVSARFKTATESSISFLPELIHNFATDGTSFGLPVYFFKNESNQLTGGLRADWNNKDDDWSFGVFVGSAL